MKRHGKTLERHFIPHFVHSTKTVGERSTFLDKSKSSLRERKNRFMGSLQIVGQEREITATSPKLEKALIGHFLMLTEKIDLLVLWLPMLGFVDFF